MYMGGCTNDFSSNYIIWQQKNHGYGMHNLRLWSPWSLLAVTAATVLTIESRTIQSSSIGRYHVVVVAIKFDSKPESFSISFDNRLSKWRRDSSGFAHVVGRECDDDCGGWDGGEGSCIEWQPPGFCPRSEHKCTPGPALAFKDFMKGEQYH